MSLSKVWAPNAVSIELVKGRDKSSFTPPINLVGTTVTYKNVSISGYWELPSTINFPLKDGDGYWFKITFQDNRVRYRIDPYSRALNSSVSYSKYSYKINLVFPAEILKDILKGISERFKIGVSFPW